MTYETLDMLIDGRFTRGSGSTGEAVINPATEDVLAWLPHADPADLDAALAASARGFETWRATPAAERQVILARAADLIEERIAEIVATLTQEMGKPLAEAKGELQFAINVLRWYGEEGKRAYGRLVPARTAGVRQMVVKEPVGPVVAFVAWNFPAVNVMRKVAGALGAGCSIVIKPSEETPGTAVAIARCFQDAGLPAGVLNVVFGVPDAVSRHLLASEIPKKMSFTGSVPVGKHLQKLAADTLKRCTMELGGHAPVLVFDDVDVEAVARMTAGGKFRNAGQVCISPTRFYVQAGVYDAFKDAFARHARALRVGSGLDDGVEMGPMANRRGIDGVEHLVREATDRGAEAVCGGNRIGNRGFFFEPTVLSNVSEDAAIMSEEPFGPVAALIPFETLEEAIARANRLPVGLASYAFTADARRLAALGESIDAGMLGLNHLGVSMPETPFGGVKESGYGSEGGIEGLEAYLRTRFVSERLP